MTFDGGSGQVTGVGPGGTPTDPTDPPTDPTDPPTTTPPPAGGDRMAVYR
ncbi:hypothetical protein NKG94_48945 [Micromonospora sp. M12]